jgi:hypothetical protein
MTREPEQQTDPLAAFFQAGEVPSVDPGFRIEVMEAVARRRFRIGLAVRAAVLAGLVVLAGLLMPVIDQLAVSLGAPLLELLVVLLVTGLVAYAGQAWLRRNPDRPLLRWRRFRIF